MEAYHKSFADRAVRSHLRGVLSNNDFAIRRLAQPSAALRGPGFDSVRLETAQQAYDWFRRAAAPAPPSASAGLPPRA